VITLVKITYQNAAKANHMLITMKYTKAGRGEPVISRSLILLGLQTLVQQDKEIGEYQERLMNGYQPNEEILQV
jgi:hypothetical protein